MAINTFDKIKLKHSPHKSRENLLPPLSKLHCLSMFSDDRLSIKDSESSKIGNESAKSPYLKNNTQISRLKEKRNIHKRATNVVSSFPLATDIYKANSDEFKSLKRGSKKVKKSVLTLPNEPVAIPQVCTVSDINDSEYLNSRDDNPKCRVKKRFQTKKDKTRCRNKDFEFYDRDVRFCSQMNIDCSSTDIIKFPGDCKNISNKRRSTAKIKTDDDFKAHDVWTVLRNINTFQYRPSPPMSDDDSVKIPMKKKKIRNKRKSNKGDRRLIETCHTEEFAYISSFDFHRKSLTSFSQSSSFDRITVIDKQEGVNIENKSKVFNVKTPRQLSNRNNKTSMNNNVKTIPPKETSYQSQRNAKNKCCKINVAQNETENILRDATNKHLNNESGQNDIAVPSTEGERLKENYKEYIGDDATDSRNFSVGCYKGANRDNIHSVNTPSFGSNQHLNGITKVILSKGLSTNEVKQLRKSSLITKNTFIPRLTTTEIKRRIANMKFPIVILGKDQLGVTSVTVTKHDFPQFEGLEQRIWPFMQDWYNKSIPKQLSQKDKKGTTAKDNIIVECKTATKNMCYTKKYNRLPPRNTNYVIENKVLSQAAANLNITKYEPTTNIILGQSKVQPLVKMKPVQHLQDNNLRLLFKKTSLKGLDEQIEISKNKAAKVNQMPVIEIKTLVKSEKADVSTETNQTALGLKISKETSKLPSAAKRKQASDFIENVITKIRNGVYYSQENVSPNKTAPYLKEAAIQTLLAGKDISKENVQIKSVNDKYSQYDTMSEDTNNFIPGFDKSPPALEIKTLNMKEIYIRHCNTNAVVQFDVTHLTETKSRNRASSLIPVAANESDTKIFKCKTTILNAVLPAELCSIIPGVLNMILESIKQPQIPMIKPFSKEANLYTISELSRNESLNVPKSTLPAVVYVSPEIAKILAGKYATKMHDAKLTKVKKPLEIVQCNIRTILPIIKCIGQLFPLLHPVHFIGPKPSGTKEHRLNRTCTALQLYKAPEFLQTFETIKTPPISKCTVSNLLEELWNQNLVIRFKIPMPLNLEFENNGNVIDIRMIPDNFEGNTIIVRNSKLDSVSTGLLKLNAVGDQIITESSKNEIKGKNCLAKKADKKDSHGYLTSATKRKSFVRLYKKCKSTSNIAGERCSTPLSKITNLDDFFQALGSSKIMSSVFDGSIGEKIIKAVFELKNWITELSQRQAMLVLLLASKKDTPNLVRFRLLLLQAIAVNRITRASELDMEIEVIEKENFNGFTSKFHAISCMLDAPENQNDLFEELCWIAKTTASDYQKPFNESSEKLLKSLLEKRRKLSPSYLRVMARYVGLGLLTMPKKK